MAKSTVTVGSARIDENGRGRGGRPGSQNGRELASQAWYKHAKGWVVLRPVDPTQAEKIALAMERAIANRHIGYDQDGRLTLYNAAAKVGFDPGRVTADVECDCSSLVRVCLAFAGIQTPNFTTANEAKVLLATGRFRQMSGGDYTDRPDYLQRGDVLVTRTQGHTVVVLNDGLFGGDPEDDALAPVNPVQPDGSIKAVTTGNYWLRDKPGLLGHKLGVVPDLSCVLVYGRSPSNPDWYGVKVLHTPDGTLNGDKGYISHKAMPGLEVSK